MGEIEQYREEWERDGDWWWGITNPYFETPNGYDVNIFHDAEGEPFRAVVYQLDPAGDDGFAVPTDELVFVFSVPTREEFQEECMLGMKKFAVEKKSVEALKVEALRGILDLDIGCVVSSIATRVEMPQEHKEYTVVVTPARQRDMFSVQVYQGVDTRKETRVEWLDLNIHVTEGIKSASGIKVFNLIEAMDYVTTNPGEHLVDASKPIRRTVLFDRTCKVIGFSDGATMRNTNPLLKIWIKEPKQAKSASLMALHNASYFNGKLVSVEGKKDVLVNIGDNLITDDGSEYLVAVYRVDKEL